MIFKKRKTKLRNMEKKKTVHKVQVHKVALHFKKSQLFLYNSVQLHEFEFVKFQILRTFCSNDGNVIKFVYRDRKMSNLFSWVG